MLWVAPVVFVSVWFPHQTLFSVCITEMLKSEKHRRLLSLEIARSFTVNFRWPRISPWDCAVGKLRYQRQMQWGERGIRRK